MYKLPLLNEISDCNISQFIFAVKLCQGLVMGVKSILNSSSKTHGVIKVQSSL